MSEELAKIIERDKYRMSAVLPTIAEMCKGAEDCHVVLQMFSGLQSERDGLVERVAVLERTYGEMDKAEDQLIAERDGLQAQLAEARGIEPELPERPETFCADSGSLKRYGIRWNGPTKPLAVPMDDGYWTPWHAAESQLQAMRTALEKYGQHDHDCPIRRRGPMAGIECTCGLEAALRGHQL